jgi:serine acetyltransferase
MHTQAERPPGLRATLRGDVGCVRARDPAARNTAEVLLLYPGIRVVLMHRVVHRSEFLQIWPAHVQQHAQASADTTCSDCDKGTTP